MGAECEVSVFTLQFGYREYWRGEKMKDAIKAMEKAKAAGYKCIKLEWRPS